MARHFGAGHANNDGRAKTVLKAFKTQDPNGNGQADEIPLSFINKPGGEDLTFLFASFGLGENWDHTVVTDDGKVVFTAAEEGYKEAIAFIHELFEEGLIDIEAFQQDWNTYLAKGKDHRYGMYFTWDKANITGMNDTYDLMPPLAGPAGEINVTRTNGIGLDREDWSLPAATRSWRKRPNGLMRCMNRSNRFRTTGELTVTIRSKIFLSWMKPKGC